MIADDLRARTLPGMAVATRNVRDFEGTGIVVITPGPFERAHKLRLARTQGAVRLAVRNTVSPGGSLSPWNRPRGCGVAALPYWPVFGSSPRARGPAPRARGGPPAWGSSPRARGPAPRIAPTIRSLRLLPARPRARARGRQCPVPAIGDEVERLEYDLSDQDLAPGCSHNCLGIGRKVPDLDHDHRHRAFFSPFVRVDDGSHSAVAESQFLCDFLRYHQIHRTGVDDAFDGRSSNVGFDAESAVDVLPVPAVFQLHAGSDPRVDALRFLVGREPVVESFGGLELQVRRICATARGAPALRRALQGRFEQPLPFWFRWRPWRVAVSLARR